MDIDIEHIMDGIIDDEVIDSLTVIPESVTDSYIEAGFRKSTGVS